MAGKILIVNADDLGRTAGINTGIIDAHRRGLVTSATLMVNHGAAAAAAAEVQRCPGLGVGLHVALTGGPPCLPPERLPSLVGADGRLPSSPAGLERAAPGEVLAEVRAQLGRFRELTGRLPTHLDSHHHAHRLPVVFDALVQVAREHTLAVRNSGGMGTRLRAAGLRTPDVFIEDFYGDGARLEVLLDVLNGVAPGVTELMCHPAHVDEELRTGSSYADARRCELEALTHPQARHAAEKAGVRLAHFGLL